MTPTVEAAGAHQRDRRTCGASGPASFSADTPRAPSALLKGRRTIRSMTDQPEPSPADADLRTFLRNVGDALLIGGPITAPPERPEVSAPVDMLDADSSKVRCDPLEVLAFVDGVQNSTCVTFREHRGVYLHYVAAAAVGYGARAIACKERLEVAASEEDLDWVRDRGGNLPVVTLAGNTPGDIERAAALTLGARREELERSLVDDLCTIPGGVLLLDGSLVGRAPLKRLVGVVKTTRKRYLADEAVLWRLPAGWRSPRFRIPAGIDGGVERFSCYLRLFDASKRGWDFALLRLEAFDPDQLDPLAALALRERQHPGARDGRWDRHLGGVRTAEDFLRARRPSIFGG